MMQGSAAHGWTEQDAGSAPSLGIRGAPMAGPCRRDLYRSACTPALGTGASYHMPHAHSRYLSPRWAESLIHLHDCRVTETAHLTKSDEEPTLFTSAGNEADRVGLV